MGLRECLQCLLGEPRVDCNEPFKILTLVANSVFLLHAGQAAAGLTLTRASHVFLMEPFMKAGEQVRALAPTVVAKARAS